MRNIKYILLLVAFVSSAVWAGSYTKTKYVKVVKRYRTHKTITREVPYQSCRYESYPVTYTDYEDVYEKNPGAPLLGAVAGGVIGHQFGGGRGKDLATVVGALAGGSIANKNYGTKHYRKPVRRTRYEQRRVCNTYYRTKRTRVTRWKNIGYLNGRKIVKISKHKLRTIPIKIRVRY